MLKKRLTLMRLLLLVFFVVACTKSPIAPQPAKSDLDIPDFEDLVPGNGAIVSDPLANVIPGSGTFLDLLGRQGIQLTSADVTLLQKVIKQKPNGHWASSKSQNESATLQTNFQRFGKMFQPALATAQDYKKKAITFASKSTVPYYMDLQYYVDTRTLLVIKWDAKTGEFVIIRSDGSLINYLISVSVQPPRYLQIMF